MGAGRGARPMSPNIVSRHGADTGCYLLLSIPAVWTNFLQWAVCLSVEQGTGVTDTSAQHGPEQRRQSKTPNVHCRIDALVHSSRRHLCKITQGAVYICSLIGWFNLHQHRRMFKK